ncbi:hypothetical protein H5410_042593, partial [Solanum commersonii]
MNIHDDPINVKNHPVDAEDPEPECCEEMQGQKELGSQYNHFSDGSNLCINQTFSNKNKLQLLLVEAAAKKSFEFATVKSCTKYLKAYSLEEFDNHFVEFKNKFPATAVVFEHDIGFEKYDVMTTNIAESLNAILIIEREHPMKSIFNSIAKWFGELFRERHAYILKSMDNQMVPATEEIARKKIKGDSLYVENVARDDNRFTVFGASVIAYVDLLEKSCSCREYDLIKIPCAHVMVVLRSKHGNEYGMSIYEYFSPLYKVEAYLLAYMDSINGVPLESKWCVLEELLNVNILPPLVDTKLERKRRKRVQGINENFKSKRRNKCSICKRTRHENY